MRTFAFIPVVSLALVAGAFGLGNSRLPMASGPVAGDVRLPGFSLPALAEGGKGLASGDLRTPKVKLLNVFASWCGGCRYEHPLLMEIARQGRVDVMGIDWKDDPRRGAEWISRNGNPYGAIGNDVSGGGSSSLGVAGAPETFLVDGRGIVRYHHCGPITPEVWKTELEPVIARLEGNT